ncbi:MAG: cytochrome c [Candidatus Binatia bacterium]|jgi:cytochrome c1
MGIMSATTTAVLLYILGVSAVTISCTKNAEQETAHRVTGEHTPPNWKFTLPPGDAVEGKKLFVELECYKCHEVKGESFPVVGEGDKGIGPELSQMADTHPPEFFAESIVNPNAVIDPQDKEMGFLGADEKSRMPTYGDVLTVKQLADLATYLNSLKKDKHSGHR